MNRPTRLFVYGTLRRRGNGELSPLLGESARFAGLATVRGHVVAVGEYLGLIPGGAGEVAGELYEFDPADWSAVLARLDAYEGLEYRREIVQARTSKGDALDTWVYVPRDHASSVSP